FPLLSRYQKRLIRRCAGRERPQRGGDTHTPSRSSGATPRMDTPAPGAPTTRSTSTHTTPRAARKPLAAAATATTHWIAACVLLAAAALLATTTNAIAQSATPAAQPFGGQPHAIPGRIQAEHFDTGGEGNAYHDTTPQNQGGAL